MMSPGGCDRGTKSRNSSVASRNGIVTESSAGIIIVIGVAFIVIGRLAWSLLGARCCGRRKNVVERLSWSVLAAQPCLGLSWLSLLPSGKNRFLAAGSVLVGGFSVFIWFFAIQKGAKADVEFRDKLAGGELVYTAYIY